ncbi:MAG: hypothetical protein ACE5KT_06585 [Methanosarcinales archaeon]
MIGRLKYKDIYGLSDHQAAALVIGRHALGYTEKVPKALKKISPRADLYFKACQWKDKTWRSIARDLYPFSSKKVLNLWMPLWSAVKRKLTHFFKTYDKKTRSRLLGSGGYTALQYALAQAPTPSGQAKGLCVLLRQYGINLRRPQKTVNFSRATLPTKSAKKN